MLVLLRLPPVMQKWQSIQRNSKTCGIDVVKRYFPKSASLLAAIERLRDMRRSGGRKDRGVAGTVDEGIPRAASICWMADT
jgi:hypothetical protein